MEFRWAIPDNLQQRLLAKYKVYYCYERLFRKVAPARKIPSSMAHFWMAPLPCSAMIYKTLIVINSYFSCLNLLFSSKSPSEIYRKDSATESSKMHSWKIFCKSRREFQSQINYSRWASTICILPYCKKINRIHPLLLYETFNWNFFRKC